MAMSPETQARYGRVLTQVVLRNGSILMARPSTFGWADYDLTRHARRCQLRTDATAEEDRWREWVDTFTGDQLVHGITLTGVSCECGRLTDRDMRWQADLSEVTQAVFEEAFAPEGEQEQ